MSRFTNISNSTIVVSIANKGTFMVNSGGSFCADKLDILNLAEIEPYLKEGSFKVDLSEVRHY